MTTFANPFSALSTMQAQEDSMEVSTDQERKNLMAMEEDNLDIDLELGDDPQQGHDEDSIMDADPEDGQAHPDGDQQMDDDFQETRDQDDEILDFADQADASVEIPMTEDALPTSTSTSIDQPSQIFPGILSQTPQTLTQGAQNQQQTQSLETKGSQQPAIEVAPQLPAAIANEAKRDPNPSEHLEAIRTLYEEPQLDQDQGQDTSRQLKKDGEDKHADTEPSEDARNAPDKANNQVEELKKTHDSLAENSHAERQEDGGEPVEKVVDEAISHPAENPNDDEDIRGAGADETTTSQVQHIEEALPVPSENEVHLPRKGISADVIDKPEETEDPADGQNDEEATVDISGIVVTCQGQQMSLFPPLQEHGTPETYLLPDSKLAGDSIRSLLKACSRLLVDSMDEHEELELLIPLLKLSFTENVAEAEHYSIRDLSDLHYQLHQNDGVEQPEPLHIALEVKTRLSGHIDHLYTLAAEGKGLHFFHGEPGLSATASENLSITTQDVNALPSQEQTKAEAVSFQLDNPENGDGSKGPDLTQDEFEHEEEEEEERNGNNTEQGDASHPVERKIDDEGTENPNKTPGSREPSSEGGTTEKGGEKVHVEENTKAEVDDDNQVASTSAEAAETVAPTGEVLEEDADPTDGADFDTLEHLFTQHPDPSPLTQPLELEDETAGQHAPEIENASVATLDKHHEDPSGRAAASSDTSSSTVQEHHETDVNPEHFNLENAEAEDFFGDEFDDVDNADDDANAGSNHLDFGLDEQQPITPQSLKRSRTAADEVGEDADDEFGHQLKRTRSG